jgi:signal transduction histidine kinase
MRRLLSYAGLAIFTLAMGGLLYWIAIRWLQHEFARAALELTHEQAEQAASQLERIFPEVAEQKSLDLGLNEDTRDEIIELVRQHPNVLLVMISDSRGRVIFCLYGRTRTAQQLRRSLFGGDLPRGIDETTLVQAIMQAFPALIEVRKELASEARHKGGLVVFVDPALPQELVERSTRHITRDLLPILVLGLMLGGAVLWLLERQRRVSERLRQQRDQAESLAHVGTLAAGLAHEIRNPVNALAMQLEMLDEDLPDQTREALTGRVNRIRQGLINLERTVHDFLNYAMPDQQRPVALDLVAEAETQALGLRESQEERLPEIQIRIPAGLTAWSDPHAFRQVLGNLLSNAMRAQRQGSKARVLIEGYREGPWVVLAVEDGGPGVAPEAVGQIFTCFYTTQNDGTGLGLPIARRLAEMNDGRLELAPRAQQLGGARFELRLPAPPPGSPSSGPRSSQAT